MDVLNKSVFPSLRPAKPDKLLAESAAEGATPTEWRSVVQGLNACGR
ncbi:hypothetical protein [Marinobacterium rhizophilum]|nr:hypothetical protein [Marinobacterium rhizophilum]